MTRRLLVSIAGAAAVSFSAAHAEPVRHVGIYVQPYYESASEPGGTPRVAVGRSFDGLASNKREDILAIRDRIAAEPKLVTPMTLMVLAIRFYDVGLRDDAVFWFYAAKNRFITAMRVADMRTRELSGVQNAMAGFVELAGPVINGYAFCDIQKQQTIAKNALKWTIDHPYTALLNPAIPALPGDRKENVRKAFNELMDSVAKEEAYLGNMQNVESIKKQRRENGADVKYCWRN